MTNDIVPEMTNFKNSILQEWTVITSTLNEDFALWNEEIFGTFNEISEKLNGTKEKLDDIDVRVSLIHKNIIALMRIFDVVWTAGRTAIKYGYASLKNKYCWLVCFIVWGWSRYSISSINIKKLPVKRFYQWGAVLLSIYLGARTGSLISF